MRLRVLSLCVLGAAAAAAAAVSCSSTPKGAKPERKAHQKVAILGFDGMDPTLVTRLMAEGKLPNLKRLSEMGTFSKLETTQPSESPVAWASFATGVNPGKHNIYDFLVRDLQTYMPDLGGVKKEPPRFKWGWMPVAKPKISSTRGGTSFWVHAGRDGVRSTILTVPMTFPPEEIAHGRMLGGLPLPDVRATLGTFSYWATDLSSFEEGNAEFGGILKRLLFEGGEARTFLKGPVNPILAQEERELKAKKREAGTLSDKDQARLEELATGKDIDLPLTVKWSEGSGQADLEIEGNRFTLKAGEWSGWIPVTFKANFLVKVHGLAQFLVVRADKELQLYANPVNLDPRDPPIPLSKPDDFAPKLAKEIGIYRTLGWAEPTDKALQEGRVDESVFLYDSQKAYEDREKIIFKSLEKDDWDLFVGVIETTDRVSHMMWRLTDPRHPMYDAALAAKYGDSIEMIYRRADATVGKMMDKLPKDTVFMVVSDHGFHSFRRSVNLNTWLVKNGYQVFEHQTPESKLTLADLFGHGRFWEGVDWSRTRAYAVGLGQIYFNLRGRESQGIVSPGAEYTALQNEIAAKLVTLTDPEGGAQVMRSVYKRDDLYKGDYLQYAPDVQVGFNDGYRVGWQDTMGGVSRDVIENNNRKWSGDHCATAAEISGGVFFSNRKISREKPHIMDVSPTVLKLLEVALPGDLDGSPLM